MLSSELTGIEGIGEKRATQLLKTFKTLKAIKEAEVDDLCKVKGITRPIAEKIYNTFRN
jgi:excinuclease ABC subunit C